MMYIDFSIQIFENSFLLFYHIAQFISIFFKFIINFVFFYIFHIIDLFQNKTIAGKP